MQSLLGLPACLLGAFALAFLTPSLCTNILTLFAGFGDSAHGRFVVFAAHVTIVAQLFNHVKFYCQK